MKIRKHYDPKESGGNGAEVVEPAADSFDAWVIPEGGLDGVDNGEPSDEPLGDDKGEPAGDEADKKGAAAAPEKKGEGEEPAGEENADDDDVLPALKDDAEVDEPETSWGDLSKAFELPDIEDATLQGQDKIAAQIKKVDELAYQRGKQEAETVDVTKYSPAEQNIFHALKGGMKMEEILKPAHGFYSAAAGTDEEIMGLYFTTALGQDQATSEDSIAVLDANGTLRIEAAKVRATLLSKAEEVVNQNVKTYSDKYAQERERIAKETERENSELKAEIMSREAFMDGKLTKEAKEKIAKRWESGYYKNLMQNDKKSVADFILFKEYGETQYAKAKAAAQKDAKMAVFQKLSNSSKTPSGSQNAAPPVAVDDFSGWGNSRPTGIEHG